MSFTLVFTDSYDRLAAKWLKRHSERRGQYLKTLQLLEVSPFHPSLRLHALQGRLQGLLSVSINLSCRITFELLITEAEVMPIDIGHHDAVNW